MSSSNEKARKSLFFSLNKLKMKKNFSANLPKVFIFSIFLLKLLKCLILVKVIISLLKAIELTISLF